MDRVEYYSGEPSGSPEMFSDPSDTSGQFVFNAGEVYGNQPPAYQYSPYRNYIPPQQPQQPNPMFMNPPVYTGFGYNQPMYQQTPYPSQPQIGAPMNYPTLNSGGYQMGVQTLDPSRMNTGFVGNPAFGLLSQWQAQGTPYMGPNSSYYDPVNQRVVFGAQQPTQDKVVTVPGYNPGGTIGMLTSDAQAICDQMQVDMMYEQQEAIAKRQQRSQGNFNYNQYGYMNYYGGYGSPFMQDNSVYNKYMRKLEDMKQEAIERRTSFNKKLSMICHNYLNDGVTEADINRIYDGYTYTIPGTSVAEYQTQERLYRLVPFNNVSAYQQHSLEVSKLYHMVAPDGLNMNEYFGNLGMFKIVDNLEKEFHRRRNTQQYYGEDIYHEYMRKYALEHDIETDQNTFNSREVSNKLADLALSKNGDVTKADIMNVLYPPEKVAELKSHGVYIDPDTGACTLDFTDLPSASNGQTVRPEIHSENELDYEMRRSAFISSIYNNNRSQVGG